MKCEECFLILDEYVEDELTGKEVAEVAQHLGDCRNCAADCELLRRDRQIYSQYFLDVQSAPDSWNRFQSDIEKYRQSRFYFLRRFKNKFDIPFFKLEYLAATVTLIVITGIVIGTIRYRFEQEAAPDQRIVSQNDANKPSQSSREEHFLKPDDNMPATSGAENEPLSKFEPARVKKNISGNTTRSALPKRSGPPESLKIVSINQKRKSDNAVDRSEREYLAAIATLSHDIKVQRKRLSPGMMTLLKQSLPNLNQTINDARRAVRKQPRDTFAIQYMTNAYAKKVELLRMIIGD